MFYPIFDNIEYPFYTINSNVHIFGSIHSNKPNTIHPEIAHIMANCDDITLEFDASSFDNMDNDKIIGLISNDFDNKDKLLSFYDACNTENVCIKKAPFYMPSAGFMYDDSLLEHLSKTKYFRTNLKGVNIKDISFCKIANDQIQLIWYGIDFHYANLYKNKKAHFTSLDENKYTTFVFTYISLIFLVFYWLMIFVRIFCGKSIMSDFGSNIHINNDNFIKLMKNIKSNTIIYNNLIVKRNKKWIPKIQKIIDEAKKSEHKSLIIIGAGHVNDLVERLANLNNGYVIEKFSYSDTVINPNL